MGSAGAEFYHVDVLDFLGVIGKMNGFTDEQLIDIRKGKSMNAKLNALVRLVASITKNRGKAEESLIDHFFTQGYTNENLVDLVLQISDKTAMNYLHNLIQIPVDFPLAPSLEASMAV